MHLVQFPSRFFLPKTFAFLGISYYLEKFFLGIFCHSVDIYIPFANLLFFLEI